MTTSEERMSEREQMEREFEKDLKVWAKRFDACFAGFHETSARWFIERGWSKPDEPCRDQLMDGTWKPEPSERRYMDFDEQEEFDENRQIEDSPVDTTPYQGERADSTLEGLLQKELDFTAAEAKEYAEQTNAEPVWHNGRIHGLGVALALAKASHGVSTQGENVVRVEDVKERIRRIVIEYGLASQAGNAAAQHDEFKEMTDVAGKLLNGIRALHGVSTQGENVREDPEINLPAEPLEPDPDEDDDVRWVPISLGDFVVSGRWPPAFERGWNKAVEYLRSRQQPENVVRVEDVVQLLRDYRCSYSLDDDRGISLADRLTPDDEISIECGEKELGILIDECRALQGAEGGDADDSEGSEFLSQGNTDVTQGEGAAEPQPCRCRAQVPKGLVCSICNPAPSPESAAPAEEPGETTA